MQRYKNQKFNLFNLPTKTNVEMENLDNKEKNNLEVVSNLKSLTNFPSNIMTFPTNQGTLFVAVDQNGQAIALTYVPH